VEVLGRAIDQLVDPNKFAIALGQRGVHARSMGAQEANPCIVQRLFDQLGGRGLSWIAARLDRQAAQQRITEQEISTGRSAAAASWTARPGTRSPSQSS
jgi:hypothetical protein